MKIRNHYKIPEIQSGYELDPGNGWFSVLMPITLTTINTNPSFELGTTGYTAVNSALARVSSYQRRGVYSMSVTPSSTALSGTYLALTTVTGSQYSCGLDLYAPGGGWFDLYFADSSGNRISRVASVRGANYWKRLWVNFSEYAGGSRRVYLVRRAGGNTQPFYVDGVNLLPTQYKVAYFDGDKKGFLAGTTPFYWNGTPHASTSTQILDCGNGGYEVNLLDLGLRVMAVVGLGMMQFANISTPISDGGARYQRSVPVERSFALVGTIMGSTLDEIQRARASLQAALTPQRTATMQELVLRYHRTDPCTGDETETLDIPCVFDSAGLAGSLTNNYQENIELPFKQYLPQILLDGQQGAVLGYQSTVANFANIGYRDIDGSWHAMGTGANDAIRTIYVDDATGYVYIGGDFSSVNGVANTDGIAYWDGAVWHAMGTGTDGGGRVFAITKGPDGKIYAGGSFSTMSGVANTSRIAVWDGSNWAPLGTGVNGSVNDFAFDADGILYVGGFFTSAGGVAVNYVASWNGTVWAAMGAGVSGGGAPGISAVSVGPNGYVYVGGAFTTGGIVACANIAQWDGSAWSALGTGLNDGVLSSKIGPDGYLYVGGGFTTAGGITAMYIARWNGNAWSALDGGALTSSVNDIEITPENHLIIAGPPSVDSYPFPDQIAVWTGTTYIPVDIDISGGSAQVHTAAYDKAGRLYVGGYWTDTDALAATITASNTGGNRAHPTIRFAGPGSVWQVRNYTNNQFVFFKNLTLLPGEIAILVTDPLNYSFTSNFRGNLQDHIAEGTTDFFLMLGSNNVSSFMTGTDANSSIDMYWTPIYDGIDQATH